MRVAFIGFGEAANAFVSGWRDAGIASTLTIRAYDIKTDHPDAAIANAKRADYARAGIDGAASLGDALRDAALVISMVTASEANKAARAAATCIAPQAFYLDCNSCAPGTKRASAQILTQSSARYVDVAVMAPVYPKLHRTPLLVSGPHAETAIPLMQQLGFDSKIIDGDIGAASSIKMVRSIMIKGLEALVMECMLAGRKAGVDSIVLDSLEASFPGFNWRDKAAYMMERVMTHGIRRAEELREVAKTVEELGLDADMSHAIVDWQQRIGELGLKSMDTGADYAERADAILSRLDAATSPLVRTG